MILISGNKNKKAAHDKVNEKKENSVLQDKETEKAAESLMDDVKDISSEENNSAADEMEKTDPVISRDEELFVLNDKYLRICAEYDNFRKRSQKERSALYEDIKASVVTGFLPVYDNLVRALEQKTEDEAYSRGVEMIMNQFNQTLEKLGVTEIPALGEKFDPAVHNAVMHVEDGEKGENEIVEVFQKGFRIGDKIIRFSMVKVAN